MQQRILWQNKRQINVYVEKKAWKNDVREKERHTFTWSFWSLWREMDANTKI